jgi:hypothetical protein
MTRCSLVFLKNFLPLSFKLENEGWCSMETRLNGITSQKISVTQWQDAGLCESCPELLVISDSSSSLSLQGLGVACSSLTFDSVHLFLHLPMSLLL